MRVQIKHNFHLLSKELRGLSDKVIRNATYRATNETARRVRKTYSMAIRQRINLPASGSSKGGGGRKPPGVKESLEVRIAQRPSRGQALGSIFATIGTSSKPISLIHFVRGSKTPPRMAGIAPNKRRKVRVSVIKGSVGVRPRMFIQEAKGAVHVWRRVNGHMLKQATGSLFSLTNKRKIPAAVQNDAGSYFQGRLLHHLRFAAMGGGKGRPR